MILQEFMSDLSSLDTYLFVLINGRLTHPVLDTVMPYITEQEHWYPVLIGLWLAMIIWGGRRGRMAAFALVLAIAMSDQVSCGLIKPLAGRVRPCNALAPGQLRMLVSRSTAFSFPSAHAANSFAMAAVASWRFGKLGPLFYFIAAAVAYSRVYVGLHYPLDALAGAMLGVLLGKIAVWAVVALRRRWDRWRELRAMDASERRAAEL